MSIKVDKIKAFEKEVQGNMSVSPSEILCCPRRCIPRPERPPGRIWKWRLYSWLANTLISIWKAKVTEILAGNLYCCSPRNLRNLLLSWSFLAGNLHNKGVGALITAGWGQNSIFHRTAEIWNSYFSHLLPCTKNILKSKLLPRVNNPFQIALCAISPYLFVLNYKTIHPTWATK